MVVFIVVLIGFVISPAVGSTIRRHASNSTCRASEFTCLDGTCISAALMCDDSWDCPDGSDEEFCYSSTLNLTEGAVSHGRFKRQSKCGLNQWQCADGTCIPVDGKCDGKVDCRDKSDETFALCRNTKCQSNWFRCTYGACVDGTAPCNNIVECADQSDELHPRCRKDTRLNKETYRCLDGKTIPAVDYCDGVQNCPDGSDETVQACAGQTCAKHLFQCAYGACVDQGAECNGRSECADGSDESAALCNTTLPDLHNRVPVISSGQCVLPPYPEHGRYVVSNDPDAKPSQGLAYATLNITCDKEYGKVNPDLVFCQGGMWNNLDKLKCVRFCKLKPHDSVRYHCLVSGKVKGSRDCNLWEPVNTEIKPECNTPNYFSDDNLRHMRCDSDGTWNRIVICKPECGRLTPNGEGQAIGGKPAMRGELPWHVAIYKKPTQEKNYYELICGGSLVSNAVVISAAHCFWDDNNKTKSAAANYEVAVAKLHSDWNHKDDVDAQTSELKGIELPELYQGAKGNFGQDIAVLQLTTPFKYFPYVRPVCLHFGYEFNQRQLEPGNLGKVAGFGFTSVNGDPSPVLKVVELPVVSGQDCLRRTPETFSENITGDKICAGYSNGTAALCQGDSGGGLSFKQETAIGGVSRYYLRGIVSTAPKTETECNLFTVTTFTKIYPFEHLINTYL